MILIIVLSFRVYKTLGIRRALVRTGICHQDDIIMQLLENLICYEKEGKSCLNFSTLWDFVFVVLREENGAFYFGAV